MAWRDLYFYWRDSHRDGQPPSRADLDPPLQIPRLLPNLFLMEPTHGNFRCRLVGSEVVRRAGRDRTGEILDPQTAPERSLSDFAILLRRAADDNAPVLYSAGHGAGNSHSAIGLLLPLIDRQGQVEMILGGLFYETMISQMPPESWKPGALVALSLTDMLKNFDGARLR